LGSPDGDILYQNVIPDIELSNYPIGEFFANIELVNENEMVEDDFSIYFEIASSDYAQLNTQILNFNHQQIILGDTGIWNMVINNNGSQNDDFALLSYNVNYTTDTCVFLYNSSPVIQSPVINSSSSENFELQLETSNMLIGTIDTVITVVRSNLDPYKIKRDTLTYEIINCSNPTVNFNVATDVCVGDVVNFADISTDVHQNASYEWDIDNDGTVDYINVGDISHIYNTAGTYNIALTINQNIGCTGTQTKTIIVHEVIANAGSDITVCEGEQITLSAFGGDYYSWDNGITQNIPFTPTGFQTK